MEAFKRRTLNVAIEEINSNPNCDLTILECSNVKKGRTIVKFKFYYAMVAKNGGFTSPELNYKLGGGMYPEPVKWEPIEPEPEEVAPLAKTEERQEAEPRPILKRSQRKKREVE
jgi:hypothetical protein